MSKEQQGRGIVKAWEATVRRSQAAAKKRANGLFATMPVAHADDDDDVSCQLRRAEKFLPNGDLYTGQWSDTLPHGPGKYLFTDGCVYVGQWFKGKITGKGRFSWPSGATYEGDFKAGFMDGKGTYTDCSGDTYKGDWVMNLKHGNGTKSYSNGDHYDGEWRHGAPDGHGKYQWKNGDHYTGNWRNGAMSGNGAMFWSNGNRFEGSWEEGYPKGNGTFRWANGDSHVGFWSQDPMEQRVTFFPSGSFEETSDWDPQELFSDLSECRICAEENVEIFPSQKMPSWPGMEGELSQKQSPSRPSPGAKGRPRRRSVDGRRRRRSVDGRVGGSDAKPYMWDSFEDVESGGFSGRHSGNSEDFDFRKTPPHQRQLRIQPVKKQGEPICKGHKNYDLMLNLQLGIRHSVGRPAPATSLDLKASAFDPKEKVWTKFPPEGSRHTPPHHSCEFKWKDYCPLVFRTLRKLFKVDAADYMLSICGNEALRELSSPGKSGSFFYLTNDDRYMIKTMKKAEVKVLLRMLPAYYNHVRAFENTLVTRFFGLHCVKLTGTAQKKVRFVIMANLFCTDYAIHRRFDLKGSSHGRTTDKPDAEISATTTLKDLDLNFIFRLQKSWFQEFCRQLDRDCDFLEQERIMDYSLLVGLHFQETTTVKESSFSEAQTPRICSPPRNEDCESEVAAPGLSRLEIDQFVYDPSWWAAVKLGVNMPARAELTIRRNGESQLIGEPIGEFYDVILFFGIIDILQDYDISKKLEHAYKSFQYDPTSISAVDPKQYSKRFRDFIFRVFTDDDNT